MCGRLRDMTHLPFPLRVAAGLAVTTAERVRDLPKQLTGLPVTVASQVLQVSMRVQQHVTELAIKGDDALATLRPVEENPSWATFDEDIEPDLSGPATPAGNVTPIGAAFDTADSHARNNGQPQAPLRDDARDTTGDDDPWAEEERALAEEHEEGEFDSPDRTGPPSPGPESADGPEPAGPAATAPAPGPAGLADYDRLTLPQVRARLRRLSLADLEEMLAYERAHADRPSFVGMLTRRIANVRQAAAGDTEGPTER